MHPKRIERPFALTVLEKTVSLQHLDQTSIRFLENAVMGNLTRLPDAHREVTENATFQGFAPG